jgi:ankyrin repeat protein
MAPAPSSVCPLLDARILVLVVVIIVATVVQPTAVHPSTRGVELDVLPNLVRQNDVAGAEHLLGRGEKLELSTVPFLLCEAAYRGRDAMTALLLRLGNADASAENEGRTPLHYVIAGFDEANRYDHGAAATGAKYAATVRVLLKAGASLSAVDQQGMSALHAACNARFSRALRLLAPAAGRVGGHAVDLRSAGGDPRKANMTALLLVASGLRRSLMLLSTTWLKHTAAPVVGTPRHNAFRAWGLGFGGARNEVYDPNTTVTRHSLEESLSKLGADLARPLLRANANVNAVDSNGWSSLHYAADMGTVELVQMLLNAGAKSDLRTHEGLTPVDCAHRRGHHSSVEQMRASLGMSAMPGTYGNYVAELGRPTVDSSVHDCDASVDNTHGLPRRMSEQFSPLIDSIEKMVIATESSCTIPTETMDQLSYESFRDKYLYQQRPVLLRNASSEVRSWPASERWSSIDALLESHGDAEMTVSTIPYASQYGLPHRKQSLRAYIEAHRLNVSLPECVFENKLSTTRPALLQDIGTLRLFDGYRVHPHQFLVGVAGSGAPFHFHQEAYNVVLTGSKLWVFREPPRATMSTDHPLITLSSGVAEGDLSCVQRANDVMFVPDSWSHLVLNLDDTVSLAVEFYPNLRTT